MKVASRKSGKNNKLNQTAKLRWIFMRHLNRKPKSLNSRSHAELQEFQQRKTRRLLC
jgi:hypothetical protein